MAIYGLKHTWTKKVTNIFKMCIYIFTKKTLLLCNILPPLGLSTFLKTYIYIYMLYKAAGTSPPSLAYPFLRTTHVSPVSLMLIKCHFVSLMLMFLADPGKARGCSANNFITY